MDDVYNFYQDYIQDEARKPHNYGHLDHPTATHEDLNPLCGDTIRMEVALDAAGRIEDIRFSGRGCNISIASASFLTQEVKGMHVDEILRMPPDSVLENLGGSILPMRKKCATLGLHVLQKALLNEIASWPDAES